MEILYFTAVAVFLYFAADWILERIESAAGRRLDNRSLVFFLILMALALTTFAVIRLYTEVP